MWVSKGEQFFNIKYIPDNTTQEKILYPASEKLNKACRDNNIYADAQYPGMCWILDAVLGIDPTNIPVDGLKRIGYGFVEKYVYTKEGSIQTDIDGFARTKRLYLTGTQLKDLQEWWEYVPEEFK